MAAGVDTATLLLAAVVLALVGLYFWHVGASMTKGIRAFNAILDSRAARERAALEHEAIHGPAPLWLKAVRAVLLTCLFGLLAAWFWLRMTAA